MEKFEEISFENRDFLERYIDKGVSSKDFSYDLVTNLFREWGYEKANIYPELFKNDVRDPHFDPIYKALEEKGIFEEQSIQKVIIQYRAIYASRIGIQYCPFVKESHKKWIEQQLEPLNGRIIFSNEKRKQILQELIQASSFESFLHTRYAGKRRFSLEGAETLIPMLSFLLEKAKENAVQEIILGMTHRGRLNVLSHILKKPYEELFYEFEDPFDIDASAGDVKYHKGFSSKIREDFTVTLVSNPSHLESIMPVISGVASGRQDALQDKEKKKVLPLVVHGDAAFSGQGVVYETFQLSQLNGYNVGGVIHLVINNHIGFTTDEEDTKSTEFCTDIAKAFGIPVVHINVEDPESCLFAIEFAFEYRKALASDIIINLNCWRKYGHNEGDEPKYTQPIMYGKVQKKEAIKDRYAKSLLQDSIIQKHDIEDIEKDIRIKLENAFQFREKKPFSFIVQEEVLLFFSINEKNLLRNAKKLLDVPEGFFLHPRLENLINKRKEMLSYGEKMTLDWGFSELLAFSVLLEQGKKIRLSGQDSRRGTFAHRHVVWIDQKQGKTYTPLEQFTTYPGQCCFLDSPLSEYAVLGFEYGYSVAHKNALVLWEAQFGDFVNNAQVILDQYIACGEEKWGQQSRLVLLLPHGYEGLGPEHSSARIERFMELASGSHLRITRPSTPAQFFHLLVEQLYIQRRAPLVVFTPKSLLRHPDCISTILECAQGFFQTVIDDPNSSDHATRLILCQGSIYYDLQSKKNTMQHEMAFIRLEQLWPLDVVLLEKIVKRYTEARELFFVQEEPENMGAWLYIKEHVKKIAAHLRVVFIARPMSAAPSSGSHAWDEKVYQDMLNRVFE